MNRGLAYGNQGDIEQAIVDFTKAIEIDPQIASAYQYRAIAYYGLGRFGQAWADVRKAKSLGAQLDPDFVEKLRQATAGALEEK